MEKQQPTREFDALLLPFLRAPDREESASLMAQLLTAHASPTIKAVIRSKLGVSLRTTDGRYENQEALEIESDVVACLLTELNELRETQSQNTIGSFKSYVAVVAFNACSKYLRRKNPARGQLKNSLRYLLTTRPEFALWQDGEQRWLCGFKQWQRRVFAPTLAEPQVKRKTDAHEVAEVELQNQQHLPLEELLSAVLREARQPIEFGKLINLIADLKGIKERSRVQDTDEDDAAEELAQVPDPRPDVASELVQRAYLQKLWLEIRELPPRQRAALLLNLKDAQGRGMIALFPLTSVATMPQLAATLEIPLEQFAAIWNELPWDDASLAVHLGITRQQVVNLRKCARERLARRMKEF